MKVKRTERTDFRLITGPLFRIAPDTVMNGDVETMRQVNSVRGGFEKAWWYQGSKHLKDTHNLFSMTNEQEWKSLRERLSKGVSCSHLLPSIFIPLPHIH